jgi:hypothetical protein
MLVNFSKFIVIVVSLFTNAFECFHMFAFLLICDFSLGVCLFFCDRVEWHVFLTHTEVNSFVWHFCVMHFSKVLFDFYNFARIVNCVHILFYSLLVFINRYVLCIVMGFCVIFQQMQTAGTDQVLYLCPPSPTTPPNL